MHAGADPLTQPRFQPQRGIASRAIQREVEREGIAAPSDQSGDQPIARLAQRQRGTQPVFGRVERRFQPQRAEAVQAVQRQARRRLAPRQPRRAIGCKDQWLAEQRRAELQPGDRQPLQRHHQRQAGQGGQHVRGRCLRRCRRPRLRCPRNGQPGGHEVGDARLTPQQLARRQGQHGVFQRQPDALGIGHFQPRHSETPGQVEPQAFEPQPWHRLHRQPRHQPAAGLCPQAPQQRDQHREQHGDPGQQAARQAHQKACPTPTYSP